MEEIKFENVLDVCSNFVDNPTEKENLEKFNELKRKLIIKKSMPIDLKEIFIDKALFEAKLINDTAVNFAVNLEVLLMFDCLLAYTNIEQTIKQQYKNYDIYNLFLDSGLYDYIYDFCERDYETLKDIAYRAFSYENLITLVDTLSTIDPENIKLFTQEFINIKQDKKYADVISDIKEISMFNDPMIAKISDMLNNITK